MVSHVSAHHHSQRLGLDTQAVTPGVDALMLRFVFLQRVSLPWSPSPSLSGGVLPFLPGDQERPHDGPPLPSAAPPHVSAMSTVLSCLVLWGSTGPEVYSEKNRTVWWSI